LNPVNSLKIYALYSSGVSNKNSKEILNKKIK